MLDMAKKNSYVLFFITAICVAFYIVVFRIMHLAEHKMFLSSQSLELTHIPPIIYKDKSDLGYCSTSENNKAIKSKSNAQDRYSYVSGSEGSEFLGSNYFELNHISISIRHGDRNAIHLMPHDANQISSQHTSSSEWLDNRAFEYLPYITPEVFHIKLLSDTVANNDIIYALSTKLNRIFPAPEIRGGKANSPVITANDEVHELDNAQLTTRGFMQHISLGHWLYSQYNQSSTVKQHHGTSTPSRGPNIHTLLTAPSISTLTSHSSAVYIRSTGYDRTVHSVTALLLGLFPVLTDPTSAAFISEKGSGEKGSGSGGAPFDILVIHNEDLEIMHGVGE